MPQRKKTSSKRKVKPTKAGRIHIRAASDEVVQEFHAYAARCGTTLSALVVSFLTQSLQNERQLTYDVEQV